MNKITKNALLVGVCFILVISTFLISVQSQENDDNTLQSYENQYGRLEVYPKVANDTKRIGLFKQWYAVYPKINATVDIAFRFDDPLRNGSLYVFNNETGFNSVSFDHVVYNDKHYYVRSNINVHYHKVLWGYWYYSPHSVNEGKWDLFVKLSSDSWADYRIHLDPWWNTSYNHFKVLTVDHQYIDESLENFTVCVHSENTTMLSMMDDGQSIRFLDNDNSTVLNHEIESFDDTSHMDVWVKIPYVSSSTNTTFLMYYNNSEAPYGENPPDSWDEYYLAVYHLHDDWADSLYLKNMSATGVPTHKGGVVSDCFNSPDDDSAYISVESDIIGGYDDTTIEFWYKGSVLDEDLGITTYWFNELPRQCLLYWDNPNGWRIIIARNGNSDSSGYGGGGSTSYFEYITGVSDRLSFNRLYVNGTSVASAVTDDDDDIDDTSVSYIGYSDGTRYANGYIDEVRYSSIVRNESWINATFRSINQSGFVTFGDEYTVPSVCECFLLNESYTNGTTGVNYSALYHNLTITIESSCGVIDYLNISCLNLSYNWTQIENGTYWLNYTFPINCSEIGEPNNITWYVNSSCSDQINNTWYWFVMAYCSGGGCSCDEIRSIVRSELNKYDALKESDNVEISISTSFLGLILVLFLLVITLWKENIIASVTAMFGVFISLAVGMSFLSNAMFSVNWWFGIMCFLLSAMFSFMVVYFFLPNRFRSK